MQGGDRVEAVLDCTGGWYARGAWEGARLERLLPAGALDRAGHNASLVVASATGDFRFFAAPGTWTLRALSPAGTGDASVAPSGAGIHEVDVKVA